jgi:hypothetical protein
VNVHDHHSDEIVRVHPKRSLVTLEGVVQGDEALPNVSYEDVPVSHYTHDFNFSVVPDPGYQHLLGVRVTDPCAKERARCAQLKYALDQVSGWTQTAAYQQEMKDWAFELGLASQALGSATCTAPPRQQRQETIEVEWESGLGQGNPLSNPAARANRRGESCGFFSAGHRRGDLIWNWPTIHDWVHVEGLWIWDRGHPPARTEIHPPFLVAIQRSLPTQVKADPIEPEGTPWYVGTQADVFASGDGSAFWNNRPSQPSYVERLPLGERDYSFKIHHPIPRPSAGASLRYRIEARPGQTFRPALAVASYPDGAAGDPVPHVVVTIPWHTGRAPDDAVVASTIYLYWDDVASHGAASTYRVRRYRVTLDSLIVKKPQDGGGAGEWRVFAEVGGRWRFLNDQFGEQLHVSHPAWQAGVQDILSAGLGLAHEDQVFVLNQPFVVLLPEGAEFRIHAGGWDADGMDNLFGVLRDPYDRKGLDDWLNSHLFTSQVYSDGSLDDPIGYVNVVQRGLRPDSRRFYTAKSRGSVQDDDPSGDTNPAGSFELRYQIVEL